MQRIIIIYGLARRRHCFGHAGDLPAHVEPGYYQLRQRHDCRVHVHGHCLVGGILWYKDLSRPGGQGKNIVWNGFQNWYPHHADRFADVCHQLGDLLYSMGTDFMEQYTSYHIKKLQEAGASGGKDRGPREKEMAAFS